jgi:hypothetical protein
MTLGAELRYLAPVVNAVESAAVSQLQVGGLRVTAVAHLASDSLLGVSTVLVGYPLNRMANTTSIVGD